MDDEPISRGFLRTLAEIDSRVELPSERLTELLDAEAERDRLRAVVDHLRESAESAIGQDRDDEYDEGNRDAWVYVCNVIDGKAGVMGGEATDGA